MAAILISWIARMNHINHINHIRKGTRTYKSRSRWFQSFCKRYKVKLCLLDSIPLIVEFIRHMCNTNLSYTGFGTMIFAISNAGFTLGKNPLVARAKKSFWQLIFLTVFLPTVSSLRVLGVRCLIKTKEPVKLINLKKVNN